MVRQVEIWWTDLALEDLERIGQEVRRSRSSASGLARQIRESVLQLRRYPRLGRVVPEFERDDYREILVPPYRIVYQLQDRRAVILRVWHGRRDLRAESVPDDDSEV